METEAQKGKVIYPKAGRPKESKQVTKKLLHLNFRLPLVKSKILKAVNHRVTVTGATVNCTSVSWIQFFNDIRNLVLHNDYWFNLPTDPKR